MIDDAHAPEHPSPAPDAPARLGLLGTMRIRKKLIILHTTFSVVLGAALLVTLRPAASTVIARAETAEALAALQLLATTGLLDPAHTPDLPDDLSLRFGSAENLLLTDDLASLALASPGKPIPALTSAAGASALIALPAPAEAPQPFALLTARIPEARRAVLQLYAFTVVAILAIYGLIAAILEMFILPQHVYGPISRLLEADQAVQLGDPAAELIDDRAIPADELGSIMRSRNDTVRSLRKHEQDLADALGRFEIVAADLKRKNHLLETARRNLADADRLASLGMLSAGIAHELNTPLTVVKGLAEKLESSGGSGLSDAEAKLLLRVVGRLERLGESLLDFARVRPPETRPARPAALISEAITLVRLDRDARSIEIASSVPESITIACDEGRIIQVFVNLIRNAVDAIARTGSPGRIDITAELLTRDASEWLALRVADTGPGIDSAILESLFEPFVSSRLDAKGTGLGLAVAEGIVREHGGAILAHNRSDRTGALFEVLLPVLPPAQPAPAPVPGRLGAPPKPRPHARDESDHV